MKVNFTLLFLLLSQFIFGQKLMEMPPENFIDLTGFDDGVYFLKYICNNLPCSNKVILTK